MSEVIITPAVLEGPLPLDPEEPAPPGRCPSGRILEPDPHWEHPQVVGG